MSSRAELARYLAEAERRRLRDSFASKPLCCPQQEAFVRSRAKRQVVRCSRRAGKTEGIANKLIGAVVEPPFTNVFYVTMTLKNAKKIIWSKLKHLNERYRFGGIPNEVEGYLNFPHLGPDVHLYLGGAASAKEADKLRGPPGKLYALDEIQSMPQRVIRPLLRDVITPSLLDYGGSMIVSGTPGAIRAGYFYDVDVGSESGSWEHHHWTWRDNSLLPRRLMGASVADIERELLEEFKLDPGDPSWLREWEGQWADDFDAVVYRYSEAKQDFKEIPEHLDRYVVAFDLGFDDADAIVVLGWSDKEPNLYVVHEEVHEKQAISPLGDQLRALYNQYHPIRVVGDLGGLGKKAGEELRIRWGLPIEAAEKARKLERIAMVNDDLRSGLLKIQKGTLLAEDAMHCTWDLDAKVRGVRKMSDDFHSDVWDALIYGHRACRHMLYEPPAKDPTPTEKLDAWEEREALRAEAADGEEWWERDAEEMSV